MPIPESEEIEAILDKHWTEIIKQVEFKPNRKSDKEIEDEARNSFIKLVQKSNEELLKRLIKQQWHYGGEPGEYAVPNRYIAAELNALKEQK